MAFEIRVPTLGESISEATIGKWLKKIGDTVEVDEPIVELETDKVNVEIPATAAGVIKTITAKEGEVVGIDAVVGTVEDSVGEGTGASAQTSKPAQTKKDEKPITAQEVYEIQVPVLGESVSEATIGKWLKQVGDTVDTDEPLVELETDKVNMEIPAKAPGVIKTIVAKEGEVVGIDAVVGTVVMGTESGQTESKPAVATSTPETSNDTSVAASPAANKMMKENNVSQNQISGSGKRGQILKEDVLSALAGINSGNVAPTPSTTSAGVAMQDEERVPMTRLRMTIAKRLKEAQNIAAMLTTFNEVDMSGVMEMRKKYKDVFEEKHNVKLGFMGFFTKAVCNALQEIPSINAQIDGDDIVYRKFVNMGVAVGTDKGLVVPVVRGAQNMQIAEIEKEINRLGKNARDGKLDMDDMMGGTFTISNGGVYGSLMSTPILNTPQSGILGMHKIQERPIAVDGEIVIKPMMYLALSYDHRIVDGKEAVMFLVRVKENIEDPKRLVLDL